MTEAVVHQELPVLGVQWHPERQALPAPQIGIEAGLAPSSTPAAQRPAPVSYTHLEKNDLEGKIAREEMKKPLLTKERIMHWLNSVSYTHLDVYKRQSLMSTLLKRKKKSLSGGYSHP